MSTESMYDLFQESAKAVGCIISYAYQHRQSIWKCIKSPQLYHMKTKPSGIFFGVDQPFQQTRERYYIRYFN